MRRKSRTAIWIILALIVIVAVLILVVRNLQKNPTPCNYNDPAKPYIKQGKGCVINFMCTQDKEAFSDECGCGCRPKTG